MLEGQLVRLEPLGPEHISDEYVAWLNDPATFRYLGTKFGQTRGSVLKYVERMQPPNLLCRIIEKSSGSHVGTISLHDIHPVHRCGELGLMIGSSAARGRGYVREAVGLLVAYAFDHLNLHKITCGTAVRVSMKRMILGLGFKLEGTLVEHYYLEGKYHDVYRFGLLRGTLSPRD